MLHTLIYVAASLALLVLAVLGFASTRPGSFSIRRSRDIQAPPDRIFPLIDSPRRMNAWNPFLEPDPAVQLTYSGPERGPGATNAWAGNSNVGAGSFEIKEVIAPTRVVGRLIMLKPMAADNVVEFTLVPKGDTTTVTWAMSGQQPLMAKVMTLFIDCDRMVGRQFDKGLASLESQVRQSIEHPRHGIA